MGFKFNTLLRAILAGGASAPWEGVTLSLSVTASSGVAPTTTTTGVAPFGVIFDLTASTAVTGDAFHDYIYFYDFGDGTAETYTYGQLAGQTKNEYVGAPIMAYTYLTPGTYTPRVWASNGVSTVGPVSGTITVTDPDDTSVFSWANTYFFHPTVLPVPGVDGVPAGATAANCKIEANFTNIVTTYMLSNRRIRLRAGETFTASASSAKNGITGITLDTYEPTPTGTYATISANFTTGNTTLQPFPNNVANNPDKWRLKNIHWTRNNSLDCTFTGSISGTVLTVSAVTSGSITVGQRAQYNGMSGTITISSFGTGSGGTGTYNLSASAGTVASSPMATTTTVCSGFVYGTKTEDYPTDSRNWEKGRLTAHNCKFSYMTAHSISGGGYGNVYSKCWVDGNGSGAAYLTGAPSTFVSNAKHYGMIDCKIDAKNSGEHAVRIQGVDKFVCVSNEFANPGDTKSFITVRGFATPQADQALAMRYANISYNYINGSASTASSPWPSQISPQNNTSQENIKDVVWEGNFYNLPQSPSIGLYVTARDVTVRNNVIYTTTTSYFNAFHTVYTNTASTLTPSNVNYYNNTVYAPNANGFSLLNTDASTTTSKLRGNIGYAPVAIKDGSNAGSAPTQVASTSVGTSNTASKNCSDAQIKSTDPLWVGPATTMAGYALTSSSYAKNEGVDLLVRTDAVNKLRSGSNFDLGAMNAPDKQVDAWTLIP